MMKTKDELESIVNSFFIDYGAKFKEDPSKQVLCDAVRKILEEKKADYIYQLFRDRNPIELITIMELILSHDTLPIKKSLVTKVVMEDLKVNTKDLSHGRPKRDTKKVRSNNRSGV